MNWKKYPVGIKLGKKSSSSDSIYQTGVLEKSCSDRYLGDECTFISNFLLQSADGWIEPQDDASHNQIYYFAKDAPAMNWYDADEYCANKGGFLAEPMTSEENNFLLGYAPSLGNVNWWTGNLPSVQAPP